MNPDCWPEFDGIPRLGLGLAGLEDHDCDPDGVVLEAAAAPSEPPPPRSSFISYLLFDCFDNQGILDLFIVFLILMS